MGKKKKETELEATWICARCGRRKEIETESDPVIERVCDLCKISNFCRLVKGAVEEVAESITPQEELDNNIDKAKEAHEFIEAAAKAETVVEEVVEEAVSEAAEEAVEEVTEEVAETNVTKTLDEQIAELQAKKEELEK